MGGEDSRGAYALLKRWYQHAPARALKPSKMNTEKFRGNFQNLYQKKEPHLPGLTLSTNVDLYNVNDKISSEA